MKIRHIGSLAVLLLTLISIAHAADLNREANLKEGGLLYDNWAKLTGTQPEGTHPLYPETGQKSGAATWRCKECHGWDYIGKDGRYAKGSHYTGIKGTYDLAGKPLSEIREALTNSAANHDFSAHLSSNQLDALAAFVRSGQTDITRAIDATGKATGSATAGKPLYDKNCSDCHGSNGQELDFKGKKDGIQGIGYLANGNPQETWHKILWGHPGSDMPSMWSDAQLTLAEAADLLAYTQTLP